MTKKVGIYSGTFDPVHTGHLAFALQALKQCGLNEVAFAPERQPRAKVAVTELKHRLALLEHALAAQPALYSLQLGSDQFSVADTMPELEQRYPGAELVLLIGSDIVQTFSYRWDGLETLLRRMSLAIGMRSQDSSAAITRDLRQLGQDLHVPVRFQLIHTNQAGAASTHIRSGKMGTEDLPPTVQQYIEQHKLYAQE
jgi:nicotinate-nucleotide adenylyltransferase